MHFIKMMLCPPHLDPGQTLLTLAITVSKRHCMAVDERENGSCGSAESIQTWQGIESRAEEREDRSGRVCVPPFLSMLIFLAAT